MAGEIEKKAAPKKAEKPAAPVRSGGVTREQLERMGLDPAPYGFKAKG